MLSLKNTTHYSVLRGLSKVDELVKIAAGYGYTSLGITDYGLAGCIEHSAECKKAGLKAILGTKILYLGKNEEELTLIAQNKKGWKNLIRLVSCSHDETNLHLGTPTIIKRDLEDLGGDILCLSKFDELKTVFGDRHYIDNFNESYYLKQEDAIDHRLITCSYLKTTFAKAHQAKDYMNFMKFFDGDCDFLYPKIVDSVLDEIEDRCENYSITGPPSLPKFPCPGGMSELQYLRELARDGYVRRKKEKWEPQLYGDRANMELSVIEKANLSGYFLIMADWINYCKKQGWLIGHGRGSSGGSLIAYFMGITECDPLPFNLLFERFYNEGRNTEDNIEYPDIDVDCPVDKRDNIINYIKDKYGHDKVTNICTFGRLQGKGALKEVLRVHSVCDQGLMNLITEKIPDEAAISDKLEESKEKSVLKWLLENDPDILKDWCQIDSDGKLTGELAKYFEQAIRIEGTFRNIGKHASGIIVSADPLSDVCPMISDKNRNKFSGFDMDALKKTGQVKLDVLGLAACDKLSKSIQLLRKGF